MSTKRRTTLLSPVSLPSGWLPVAVACGSGAALLGLALTRIGLAVAGVSPGDSEVARWMVGGPISAVEGSIWFLFDAHWVRIRTGPGLSNHVIFGHPLIQADAALWPLRAVPLVLGLGGTGAVRYLGIDDPVAGAVTGAEAAGVAAGPDLAANLLPVTVTGVIVGGLAGAVATAAASD